MNVSSRRAQLMRLELADHIRLFLERQMDGEALIDWAVDHPFFEDRAELTDVDQQVLGEALGRVLTMGPEEPLAQRATREDLIQSVEKLARL